MVAAPLLDSSSGCACTVISRSGPALLGSIEDMGTAAFLPTRAPWEADVSGVGVSMVADMPDGSCNAAGRPVLPRAAVIAFRNHRT